MTDEELIARLRDFATREASAMPPGWPDAHGLYSDAADLIEALVKERAGLLTTWAESRERHLSSEARAERLEAALRGLMMHEPDHPDTLWQDARAALKGEDHE